MLAREESGSTDEAVSVVSDVIDEGDGLDEETSVAGATYAEQTVNPAATPAPPRSGAAAPAAIGSNAEASPFGDNASSALETEGTASLRVFQSPNRLGLGVSVQARF